MAHDIEQLYVEELIETIDPILEKMDQKRIPYILGIVTQEDDERSKLRVCVNVIPERMAIPAQIVARFQKADQMGISAFHISLITLNDLRLGNMEKYPEFFDCGDYFQEEVQPALRTLSQRLVQMNTPHSFFACPKRGPTSVNEFLASYIAETESPLIWSMHEMLCKNPVLSGIEALSIATRFYSLLG